MPKRHLLATALMVALTPPALAQTATDTPPAPQARDEATELDAVVVTGIRASLQSSMNLKRGAQGVVDGIVAEDIGKFPDTNLAESMQRISGVSIDRQNGEGSKVTVRGVGPDFNLVLLNGRQMPTATGGRAFEFSDLASEAISAISRGVQVVVAGDTQQLAPTSFFQRTAAGEDTDDAVAPLRAVVLDAAARTRASLDGRTG